MKSERLDNIYLFFSPDSPLSQISWLGPSYFLNFFAGDWSWMANFYINLNIDKVGIVLNVKKKSRDSFEEICNVWFAIQPW